MPEIQIDLVSAAGILLVIALGVALLGEIIHIPKVTSYLLVGLLLGPSVLGIVTVEHIHGMHLITELAMALVLFNLGLHFPLKHLRKIAKRSLQLSLGEITVTFLTVTAGIFLFTGNWQTAILLGCLALATAPATTILVLKEFKSEGPITEYTSVLVAINNLVCIVAFEIAFVCFAWHSGNGGAESGANDGALAWLFISMFGSVALGSIAGFVVSYGCGLLKPGLWLVLIIAICTIVLGLSNQLAMPYMVAFMVMGMVVANLTEDHIGIVNEIDRILSLLCVLFFAVHGADLNLSLLWTVGTVGVVYIVTRIAGKFFGVLLATTLVKERPEVRHWLGLSLMAQAGAAIALCAIAVRRDPEIGKPIQAIILGSVVLFEIVGPLLIRQSLLRSGEIPLAQAIHHTSHSFLGELRQMWNRLVSSVGRDPNPTQSAGHTRVSDIIRKNVKGISQDADFETVIAHIEQSHDNIYPVVNHELEVVGMLRYTNFSQTLFDPTVSSLVRAIDLTTQTDKVLHLDDEASVAIDFFQDSNDDLLPIVSREKPQVLLGVVRQTDVRALLIQKRKSDKSSVIQDANEELPNKTDLDPKNGVE